MTEPKRFAINERNEWLEADGLGGFASGTTNGIRTRRYHGLLLTAVTPPTGRIMLINGFEAWVELDGERRALSSQRYSPDVIHPDGASHIRSFVSDPWPTWTYQFDDGLTIEHQIFVPRDTPMVLSSWRRSAGPTTGTLHVRPLVSGRDIHSLHHENPTFWFDAATESDRVTWQPYTDLPAIVALSNGTYAHDPLWFRSFLYSEERNRGHDFNEDLASFGTFRWKFDRGEAALILAAQMAGADEVMPRERASAVLRRFRDKERRRRDRFETRLHRAADAYIVRRGSGQTIVAGYPWFTDWGRDTFISVRGLCLATGRLNEARDILLRWAGEVSQGMLPNRFVESGDAPEFNSVDAALWYIIAVHDFQRAMKAARRRLSAHERKTLNSAIDAILEGYASGTRHGIRMDTDGLLQAGEPGVQLTWMDAKVGDWVVTPRIGKPVELQALWLNALKIGHDLTGLWRVQYDSGRAAFHDRFWNEAGGYLHDVVDVNHQPGTVDASFRPNQIFAVGGLPITVCAEDRARPVVDAVEARLLTPIGLRTLEPGAADYKPRYEGGVLERDGAYHQGTAWPWLLGPFVEAWVRVRGGDSDARNEARHRFMTPLLNHLDEAGLGHISEIADADPPNEPRGCPFQAWSVGEAVRVSVEVLGERPAARRRPKPSRTPSRGRVTIVR